MRFRSARIGAGLVRAGFVGAILGVPLVASPVGYNPFGPAKLLVLCAAATLVALGLALDLRAANRVRDALGRPVGLWLVALLALFVLSAALATDPRAAFAGVYPGYEAGLVALAAMLLTGFLAAVAIPAAATVLSRSLSVALVFVGLAALVERASGTGAALLATRVGATLGNASNLGLWCAIALPWAARSLLAKDSKSWRVLSAAALTFGVIGIALSGSRGAALAVIVQLIVGAGLLFRFDPRRTRRAALGFLLVACLMCALLVAQATSVSRQAGPDTVTGRLDTWRSTAPLIARHPFLGVGPAGFGRAFAATTEIPLTDALGRDRPLEDPHNVVLSMAVSAGPIAALCLLGLAGSVATLAWRSGNVSVDVPLAVAALAAGFVGLQFHFLTLDAGPVLFGSLGVMAGVLAASEGAHDSTEDVGGTDRGRRTAVSVAAAALGLVYLGATVAAGGIVTADMALYRGFGAAQSDWPQAESRFVSARASAPWDPTFAWALGRAAREAIPGADGDQALRVGEHALKDAAAMRPGDHRIARDLGDLYAAAAFAAGSDAELLEQAAQSYEAAIALAPTDGLNWLGIGSVHLASGRLELAVTELTRAVELAPDLAVAWENLASAKGAVGDRSGAHEASERAKELSAVQAGE